MPTEAELVPATADVTSPLADSETIVGRVVVSAKDAPVTRTALVLSDAILAELVIKGPLPSST
jgi:hypothetical protein